MDNFYDLEGAGERKHNKSTHTCPSLPIHGPTHHTDALFTHNKISAIALESESKKIRRELAKKSNPAAQHLADLEVNGNAS
jgi:hypothetical protein